MVISGGKLYAMVSPEVPTQARPVHLAESVNLYGNDGNDSDILKYGVTGYAYQGTSDSQAERDWKAFFSVSNMIAIPTEL